MVAYTSTLGMFVPKGRERAKRVAAEYGKWLNLMEWDFFCTFTTRYKLSVKSARRAMERLYNHLKARWGKFRMFWVAEPFDTQESFHTHALIYLDSSQSQDSAIAIKNGWQVVTKGKGRKEYHQTNLRPYIKDYGAHFYVGKYLTQNNADHDYLL